MIQKYSAYVPIHHLYKGQVGAKGHCCAFKQNVMDISLVLPRKPADIKFIQVIKKYKDKSGDVGEKKFIIRREKVMNALRWLKKYNRHYDDIIIAEENMNWMNGNDEAEIPSDSM